MKKSESLGRNALPSARVLILGVGNILLSDEGVGVRAIEYLKENYSLPKGVDVFDGGCGGMSLLPVIEKGVGDTRYSNIIIIDAIRAGGRAGDVLRIKGSRSPKRKPRAAGCHQIGMEELLSIASLKGYSPEAVIIGVCPFAMAAGTKLSTIVESRMPDIIKMIKGELKKLGIDLKRKT